MRQTVNRNAKVLEWYRMRNSRGSGLNCIPAGGVCECRGGRAVRAIGAALDRCNCAEFDGRKCAPRRFITILSQQANVQVGLFRHFWRARRGAGRSHLSGSERKNLQNRLRERVETAHPAGSLKVDAKRKGSSGRKESKSSRNQSRKL